MRQAAGLAQGKEASRGRYPAGLYYYSAVMYRRSRGEDREDQFLRDCGINGRARISIGLQAALPFDGDEGARSSTRQEKRCLCHLVQYLDILLEDAELPQARQGAPQLWLEYDQKPYY